MAASVRSTVPAAGAAAKLPCHEDIDGGKGLDAVAVFQLAEGNQTPLALLPVKYVVILQNAPNGGRIVLARPFKPHTADQVLSPHGNFHVVVKLGLAECVEGKLRQE